MPYSSDGINLQRIGNIVIANGNVRYNNSGDNNYTPANETIPVGYRPIVGNTVIASTNVTFTLMLATNGNVTLLGNPKSSYSPLHGMWITRDQMPD